MHMFLLQNILPKGIKQYFWVHTSVYGITSVLAKAKEGF